MIFSYKKTWLPVIIVVVICAIAVSIVVLNTLKNDTVDGPGQQTSAVSTSQQNTQSGDSTDTSKDNSGDKSASADTNSNELDKGSEDLSGKDVPENVKFYMDKLSDKSYTKLYGEGYTWYTAAEELGLIGKPAFPSLIERIETKDDYERALVFYALLLATQNENVASITNGEYIEVNLDFDVTQHTAMKEKCMAWWDKYKDKF